MSNNTNKANNNPFDIFVIGARKGFTVATQNLLPNVLMAYTLSEILNLLGVMKMIGSIFGPAMGLFGLPGGAVTRLLTAWLSCYFPFGFPNPIHGPFARCSGCS